MFKNLRQIFNPKNKDLRKRIGFSLFGLLIFAVGTTIVVPGTAPIDDNIGFLEIFNAMSGGALKSYSIFGLGVMPYISASILMSLLQMDIIPYFSELKKDGHRGQQKLNQITRYVGILFAFIQGFAIAFAFPTSGNNSALEYLRISVIMTGGTAFLLWLGDQMTQKGIGNGMSLIIMAGIIGTLPQMFIDAFTSLVSTNGNSFMGIVSFSLFILIYLIIVIGVVFVEKSERRVPIQYANQTSSAYGKKQSYLPFRLNSAGVTPVIFASALISIMSLLASVIKNGDFQNFVTNYIEYTTPTGLVLYIILIFFFCYFYTFLQMNPEEMSKNLNKNGGYIPGIRPGKETTTYIKKVLSRLTFVGSIFLVIISIMPIIFGSFIDTGLPASVSIGGTSILIVVGVALETYRQLESSLVNRSYKGGK